MRLLPPVRNARQTLDICIAILVVLVVIYDITVAIERNANRAAARNVIDAPRHMHASCDRLPRDLIGLKAHSNSIRL
jgi:hypothetical protein